MIFDRAFLWIGCIIYALAFIFALVSLARSRRYPRLILVLIVAGGFLFQTFGLYERGLEAQRCPISNTFEILQFITWSAILLYLLVGPAFRLSLLGFFTSGLAAVLGIVSLLVPAWDPVRASTVFGDDPWIAAHASLAIFSYGIFGLLALTAWMYLIQNYGLRKKRFRGLFALLPSILELDHMNGRLLLTGVSVLSFSLAIGGLHWLGDKETVRSLKLITTTVVWLAYFAVMVLHRSNRLIARRYAWTCMVLFIVALLTLWPVDVSRPVRIVPPNTHSVR
jgi:ABC-type uncharacterized transport system permease subunit